MAIHPTYLRTSAAIALATALTATPLFAQDGDVITLEAIDVQSYEEEVLQALGVSTITSDELDKRPVANDISEIVRKMPGVNLTGSSPSGQRGNQRQIDLRGMGPENTLILIDGKPVLSRSSVKMGRSGERDSRGDSNWFPAELVDKIEVIRGPAAARYGSGAAGGVVNIITKKPESDVFNVNLRYTQPQSDLEGGDKRVNFMWAKPLSDRLSFRLTGNYNVSDADDPAINAETVEDGESYAAGAEGVINKDLTALLTFAPSGANSYDFELGYSRQGNIYAGDAQLGARLDGTPDTEIETLAEEGAETSVMKRITAAATHNGSYEWADTKSYLQYEHTNNRRLTEGLNGGGEGSINSTSDYDTAKLDAVTAKTEATMERLLLNRNASVTLGGELRYERLDLSDYTLRGLEFDYGDTNADADDNDPISSQLNIGLFAESNIEWNDRLTITPSVRVDWANTFGTNLSGSLNASYALSSNWTVKGGVARAFKSPNLYQLSETYVYGTRGRGCPYQADGTRLSNCRVLGNPDLDPETSINKEIGLAYSAANGVNATLTYFHNDYRNKIQAGTVRVGEITEGGTTYNVFQWDNIPESVVSGLEGSFAAPLRHNLDFSVNGTYMIASEQKLPTQAGPSVTVPLSLVPKYTINASLEYRPTDKWTIIPSLTHYGRIDASGYNTTTGTANDDLTDRDPYTLVDLAVRYELNDSVSLTGGVTNVFDKKILRSNSGANTYNEPGRAFYVGLSATF